MNEVKRTALPIAHLLKGQRVKLQKIGFNGKVTETEVVIVNFEQLKLL